MSNVKHFRFKPFTVEAYKFQGMDKLDEAPEWVKELNIFEEFGHLWFFHKVLGDPNTEPMHIQVTEGWWIVKSTDFGGIYALSPEAIEASYEEVENNGA